MPKIYHTIVETKLSTVLACRARKSFTDVPTAYTMQSTSGKKVYILSGEAKYLSTSFHRILNQTTLKNLPSAHLPPPHPSLHLSTSYRRKRIERNHICTWPLRRNNIHPPSPLASISWYTGRWKTKRGVKYIHVGGHCGRLSDWGRWP